MYCEKCGHALQKGDVHCAFCGTKHQGRIGTVVAGADGVPGRRRVVILLSYAAGLLIFAATALVFGGGQLFGDKGKPAGPALQASPTVFVVASIDVIPKTPAPVATPAARLSIGEEAALKAMEGYTDDTAVIFADSQVEAWIRARYIQKTEAITVADMKRITSFEYDSANDTSANLPLTTLFDLRYCENLQTLRIVNQSVASIESLRNLPNLSVVYIYGCAVSDLSPLAGKPLLQSVRVSGNPVVDASPVLALPGLTNFNAYWGTGITDISALRNTHGLTGFFCTNRLNDYTPLLGHTGMKDIALSGISNGDFIAMMLTFKDLSTFSVSASKIEEKNLELFAGRNLYGLTLENCGIQDISALSKLAGVNDLRLGDNQIKDISALSRLTMISYNLDLRNNWITDYSPLKGMKYLKSLTVSGNAVIDDETLRELEKNGCKVNR